MLFRSRVHLRVTTWQDKTSTFHTIHVLFNAIRNLSIYQVNNVHKLCPILIIAVRLNLVRILERESISIRNAKFLSSFDVSKRSVRDEEIFDVSFPSDVLAFGRVIEHASEAEDDGLGCGR